MSDFKIVEIKPRIFLFKFKDHYKMSMHFLRYSEFYESISSKFRGKQFTIIDFMEWYVSKNKEVSFLYPSHWGGFNFPGKIIKQVHDLKIKDYNKYDQAMLEGFKYCKNKNKYKDKFYIIGAMDEKTLKHEIAHGMFYLNSKYKREMTDLVKSLDFELKKEIFKDLTELGYASKVHIDEAQAYLSTGMYRGASADLKKISKPFIKIFKKFYD